MASCLAQTSSVITVSVVYQPFSSIAAQSFWSTAGLSSSPESVSFSCCWRLAFNLSFEWCGLHGPCYHRESDTCSCNRWPTETAPTLSEETAFKASWLCTQVGFASSSATLASAHSDFDVVRFQTLRLSSPATASCSPTTLITSANRKSETGVFTPSVMESGFSLMSCLASSNFFVFATSVTALDELRTGCYSGRRHCCKWFRRLLAWWIRACFGYQEFKPFGCLSCSSKSAFKLIRAGFAASWTEDSSALIRHRCL